MVASRCLKHSHPVGNLIVLLIFRYESYPEDCGDFDDLDFIASDMCCACAPCIVDTAGDATDTGGDGCEWSRRGVRNILTMVEI